MFKVKCLVLLILRWEFHVNLSHLFQLRCVSELYTRSARSSLAIATDTPTPANDTLSIDYKLSDIPTHKVLTSITIIFKNNILLKINNV